MLSTQQILEALAADITMYRTSRDLLERGLAVRAQASSHTLVVYVADLCALKNKLQAMEQFQDRLAALC